MRRRVPGLAVLSVQQIPYGLAALGVHFAVRLFARLAAFGFFFTSILCAALRAAISVTGLARPQFELLSTHNARLDRESHNRTIIGRSRGYVYTGGYEAEVSVKGEETAKPGVESPYACGE